MSDLTCALLGRYLPSHQFQTDAVFSIDDDEHVSCKLMTTAFGVWQHNKESMVGFNPRHVDFAIPSASEMKENADEDDGADLGYSWNSVCRRSGRPESFAPCGEYNSLFVTKGGFLHKRFLALYFSSVRPLCSPIFRYLKSHFLFYGVVSVSRCVLPSTCRKVFFKLMKLRNNWDQAWASAVSMVDKWTTGEDMLMAAVHAAHMAPGTVHHKLKHYTPFQNGANILM